MARIKRAQNRKVRTKKLFKRSKGFFLARNNTRRQANEAVMKARANAYVGRKQRKRLRAEAGSPSPRTPALTGGTKRLMEKMIQALDKQGNGKVDRDELKAIVTPRMVGR